MLFVARMLDQGSLWSTWIATLRSTQVSWSHESAVMLPIIAGTQALVGLRFGLPTLEGALMGGLSVVLAWLLGRRMRSPAFGLVFAALIAASPLQLTWSRLGIFYIGAVPHVLLAMLAGWEAGRRGSIALAVATGVIAWASVYEYYAARVAIPLAFVAMAAGAQGSPRPRRGLLMMVAGALAFAGIGFALHPDATLATLWPQYGGYAGSKGEQSVGEFIARNAATAWAEMRKTMDRYFVHRRIGWQDEPLAWGMSYGGLCLLPVAVLGGVGIVATVRRIGRRWPWLVLAVLGLALPALSRMTARRMLVFDVAWCAFAGHGILALADMLGRHASRATRGIAVATAVAVVAIVGATTVFTLDAALPPSARQPIPFGEAGFGDGLACKRCVDAAKAWRDDIADGSFVVLFDNDLRRENPTSPGGLPTYGKIASLQAGAPERFVEAYRLMADRNWDVDGSAVFDKTRTNFGAYLSEQIEQTTPRRIVWHFERPSAWESWLAGRLVEAGGTAGTFATPLAFGAAVPRGLRVTTPWERREDALALVRDLASGTVPDAESRCVWLAPATASDAAAPVFLLATADAGLGGPPTWLLASWRDHHFGATRVATSNGPAGVWVSPGTGANVRIDFMSQRGDHTLVDVPSLRRELRPPVTADRPGLNCAVHAAGHWWVLSPTDGRIVSTHPGVAAVPKGPWIGISEGAGGAVVLASATQELVVFDPAQRVVVSRLRARVSPSLRDTTDECVPIAVGADWFATANLRSGVLNVYDRSGRDLGTRRLNEAMNVEWPLTSIAGAGRYLGVAAGTVVRTFEVRVDPSCRSPTAQRPARE